MGFLPNLSNIFSGKEKPEDSPELDNTIKATKEKLQGLKKEIDIFTAFEKDLDELGIKDPREREEYKNILRERLLAESPELADVEEFVGNVAKYTKLDELIEKCKKAKSGDPLERFAKTLKENVPWLATGIGWILSFKISEPEEGKKMSDLDIKLAKLAAILSGEEPEEENIKENESAIAQTDKEKGNVEALAGKSRENVKSAFTKAELTFNEEEYNEDIAYLYSQGIKTSEQIISLISEAEDNEIIKSIKKNMSGDMESIKLSLKDIYLFADKLKEKQDIVTDGMAKYAKNNPEDMNKYLDAVRNLPADDKAIEKYLNTIEGTASDVA